MLVMILLIASLCSVGPCPDEYNDDSNCPFFFMKNITDRQIQYSVRMEQEEVCVCINATCSRKTLSQLQFQSNTIYRVNGTKDVFLKYNKSRHRAYPYSILGTKYVVPVLYLISSISTHNILGIGNPTNKSIDVHVKYPRRNPFSVRSCQNVSYELRLDAFESIDLENNCQIAGVHINSSNKIMVYSASRFVMASYVMIDQLLPVELWGSFYIVSSLTDDILHDNIVLVLTAYDNTAVHILGYDYVIIPNKYGSIQRRINGTDPVTIQSSLPVSVTQYIKNKHNWVMINVIPMKYEINKDDIFHMVNIMYAFGTMENDALRSSENKLPIFSRFHYYTSILSTNLLQTLHGCVTSKTISSGQIVATNCGFTDPSHSEPDWPIMEPGDRKDNDLDGDIDEDECFLSFSNLNDSVNKDCKYPFGSGFPDTFGSMFILPTNKTWTVKCSVEILSGTPPTAVEVYSKSMKNGIIDWNMTTIQVNNHGFIIDPDIIDLTLPTKPDRRLVIATIDSNDVSLICSCYNFNTTCSNSFIVPPVDILQTQYVLTMPYISENGNNNHIQCDVVTIFDNTSFALPMLNISHESIPRLTTTRIHWTMQNSSVFIVASHVISVVCYQGFDDNYLVNYILPSFGTDYKMCKNENQTKEIVMVSLDHNTVLEISEINPDNYTEHLLLETGGSFRSHQMKNLTSFLFIKANKPILVLAMIETSSSSSNHNIIYIPATNLELNGNMTSSNDPESECINLSDYDQPQPLRLYRREFPTVTEQIPGDGIDNDRDGLVDEEYCGFLWEDDSISDIDLDGTMNEDCKGCKEGEELSLLFECKGCDYGKFREKASKIDFCQSCPKNQTTFDTRSNSSKDCVPICEEGTELNSMKETCEPCSIGFYKNVSANDISLNKTERFECKRCPGNLTTYSTKSTDISNCIEHCDSGQYLFQNRTCLPCEIGRYKHTSSQDISLDVILRWNCLACEEPYTTISVGSKACIMPCSEGYQINLTSQKCEPCPLGFYKNVTGIHINCTQCPDNYTTRAPGKKSQNDCKKADCTCPCNMVHVQKNYTSSELSKIIEKMKKELMVNKEQLSSTLRKKISVMDNRPSSQSIGSFGVVIIVFVFSLFLAADVMILKNHISMLVRTVVDFAKRFARN